MITYIDTSIIVRHLLGEPAPYPIERFREGYTSEIARIEALRAIDRLRIQAQWTAEMVMDRIRVLTALMATLKEVPLQQPILRRAAEPFPTIVKTLDAIHLATALLTAAQLSKLLVFLTHDRQQGIAAMAAGLTVEGF